MTQTSAQPDVQALLRQFRWQQGLQNLAQQVSSLGRGGPAPQMRGNGLLDELKLQAFLERMQDQQIERTQADRRASEYTKFVGGLDPTTGIDWRSGRVSPQMPAPASNGAAPDPAALLRESRTAAGQLGFTGPQQALLRGLGPEAGFGIMTEQAFARPRAPTTRNRTEGGETIVEQWNPGAGSWTEVSRGPRWSPKEGGGQTAAQRRDNAEIDQARQTLAAMALTRDDLIRRTRKTTDTGRDNPEFDPYLANQVRLGTQRKIGPDPEYPGFYTRFFGSQPPPEAAVPDTPDEEGDGLWSNLFGGGGPDQPPAGTGPPQARSGRYPRISPSGAAAPPAPTAPPTTALPAWRNPRAPRPPATRPIAQMAVEELAGALRKPGLTAAERAAIDARLRQLGF